MKKALSILLLAVLCLSLFSCDFTLGVTNDEMSVEEYLSRPFSTGFNGYANGNSARKIDITADHSVFFKDAIEFTLYFAISNHSDSVDLERFAQYKIMVTTAESQLYQNENNVWTVEKTTSGYDADEFLGCYELGRGDIIHDESPLPEIDPCTYNHSEKITVPPYIFVNETGTLSFVIYLKFAGDEDYISTPIHSLCAGTIYYKIIEDNVFISSTPFLGVN